MTTIDDLPAQQAASSARVTPITSFYRNLPFWLVILVVGWLLLAWAIVSDPLYREIFETLRAGIPMTLFVAGCAYVIAILLGLMIGLVRANPPKKVTFRSPSSVIHWLLYHLLTVYVEVVRGLPILIVLLIGTYVIFPQVVERITGVNVRAGVPTPAIIALGFAYGAFISETVRAGIQSIDKGQGEAARALGMTYFQTMRSVILPQAFRRVLPPLGNDLIAMIKDSSLVSALSIRDVTQIGRLYASNSFQTVETYLVIAFIYLTLTLIGSMIVRYLERRTKQQTR